MTLVQAYEQKGRNEGLNEGIERGIERGIEKGRLETLHSMAMKLMRRGDTFEMVAELTGLPIKELQKLSKRNDN